MTTELCGSKMLGDYSFKQIATPPKTPKKTTQRHINHWKGEERIQMKKKSQIKY